MTIERGDVVLLEFPYTNRRQKKKRPALVLSTAQYHDDREEVVLAAISSNLAWHRHGDTELAYWKEAGLGLPSIVTALVQTMTRKLILRTLGRLEDSDLRHVEVNLAAALGFDERIFEDS